VRAGFSAEDSSGRFARVWDGRDDFAVLLPPGIYLYRVRVDADAGEVSRAGLVHLVY